MLKASLLRTSFRRTEGTEQEFAGLRSWESKEWKDFIFNYLTAPTELLRTTGKSFA